MDEELLYQKIQQALENIPENFSVLEEQIDVHLQVEYFEFAGKLRKSKKLKQLRADRELLFEPDVVFEIKKKILTALASSAEVEDFRAIEKYRNNPESELKDWSVLALQESRMMLQSSLLDEQQVYISTGMGGKGQKLRYFVVFLNAGGTELTDMQAKLLKDELTYALHNNDGELEEYNSLLDYTTAVVVLPLKAPLKTLFRDIVTECNQYGCFLKEDLVVTNVKKLNPLEIVDLLNQQKGLDEEDIEELE